MPNRFILHNLTARAHDGVNVPLTLIRPKGAKGSAPVLLYAYGSYGISTLPNFRPLWIPFMAMGASTAYCHVRGGGELGESLAPGRQGRQQTQHLARSDCLRGNSDCPRRGHAPHSLYPRRVRRWNYGGPGHGRAARAVCRRDRSGAGGQYPARRNRGQRSGEYSGVRHQ